MNGASRYWIAIRRTAYNANRSAGDLTKLGPGWFEEACLAIEAGHGGVRLALSQPTPPVSPPAAGADRRQGDTPWQQLSVLELRALLRDGAVDRTSLPAQLRRAPHMPSRPEIRLPASGFLTRMLVPVQGSGRLTANFRPAEPLTAA